MQVDAPASFGADVLKWLKIKLDQETIVEVLNICVECGCLLNSSSDGTLCCVSCGREYEFGRMEENRIPMSEEGCEQGHSENNYNPGCNLAFGNGLGSQIKVNDLYRVLVQCSQGQPSGSNGDLGLRARCIRILTSKLDHPIITTLLSYGNALCKEYDLNNGDPVDLQFAETLGIMLRRIGALYALRNESNVRMKSLANACFCAVYKRFFLNTGAMLKAMRELKVQEGDINYVEYINSALEPRNWRK